MNGVKYWIQEQNPHGNWFDSYGMVDLDRAVENLQSFRRTFPDRKFRMVKRVDSVVEI